MHFTRIILFLLSLLAFGAFDAVAQFPTPLSDNIYFNSPDRKVRGKVKWMEIRRKTLIEKDAPVLKTWNHPLFSYPHNSFLLISYREDGNIDKIETFDSLNRLEEKEIFEYDGQNRIVERNVTKKDGITKKICTYTYDSLNRWDKTISYDSLNKPSYAEVRIYKGNTVTQITKYDSGKSKTIYTYEPGKTIHETYNSDGTLYFKSEEKIKGATKTVASALYNQKEEKWGIVSSKETSKEIYTKDIVFPKRNV